MRKSIVAAACGLALVAGQAAAANNSAATRVSDRVGANATESSEIAGVPLPILLIGVAAIVAVVAITDDDSESD